MKKQKQNELHRHTLALMEVQDKMSTILNNFKILKNAVENDADIIYLIDFVEFINDKQLELSKFVDDCVFNSSSQEQVRK